ncbi:hypothetical protein [Aquirhabdus parva]|uniref:CheW-like domain-containing protein n=1 Tax=Aquirhabdus parva TaxID=2283318 RepID=A0A345P7U3_9GAMM|nr:hypothetical protein [Aquirhabdus parva]AXI03352.1 hypothetical protein HYN46_11160 [Aquirhabdus parva]
MNEMKSAGSKSAQQQNFNQTMSLITTSGTLELYVLALDDGILGVLPQSLVLDIVALNPSEANDTYFTWQEKKIPLISVANARRTHALVIEGVEDHLQYAFALISAPITRKIRISAMKDIDSVDKHLANHPAHHYTYQYVQHEDQLWIVPDLELIERELKESGSV